MLTSTSASAQRRHERDLLGIADGFIVVHAKNLVHSDADCGRANRRAEQGVIFAQPRAQLSNGADRAGNLALRLARWQA
jgi:hypothetical protein